MPAKKQRSIISSRFSFVDFWKTDKNKKPDKWRRIHMSEIEENVMKASAYNCHTSVQRYAMPEKMEGEDTYLPLYFDMDINENLNQTFEDVQKEAMRIINFFKSLDIPNEFIRVYFSGSRGFHVFVHPDMLGVTPMPDLTKVYKFIGRDLQKLLSLKNMDEDIYISRKMLRLPNTINPKSNLYKIELNHIDVMLPVDRIKAMAKSPRKALYDERELDGTMPFDKPSQWFKKYLTKFEEFKFTAKLKPHAPPKVVKDYPVCIKDLLKNNIKESGTRNQATISLSCFFKSQGLSLVEAQKKLAEWVRGTPSNLTSTPNLKQRMAESLGVAQCVYNSTKYDWICSVARKLKMECNYSECKMTSDEDQAPSEAIETTLSKSSDAAYYNKRIKLNIMVCGKGKSPYMYPRKIMLNCKPNIEAPKSNCYFCDMVKSEGHKEINISEKSPLLLSLIDRSTAAQYTAIKKIACGGGLDCRRLSIDILDRGNIEQLELIPEITYTVDLDKANEYVSRECFYIGKNVKNNQEYEIEGYSFPHPETQMATVLFSQKRGATTALSEFKMNPDIYKRLKTFQVQPGQSVAEKFNDIHTDLERNAYHIWKRKEMFYGFDLVYHSVVSFFFQGQIMKRGWMECMVIGDSGCAKTTALEALMSHYRLGLKVSGEGAKRTGLSHSYQNVGSNWITKFGVIPNNDRRLIGLDEFSELNDNEFSKLRDMRSSGIADATGGIAGGKAYARTRIIFLSNPKKGSIRDYSYGVQSIGGIMPKVPDIRRLDFAMCVRTGDVENNIVNQNANMLSPVKHVYSTDICHDLILYAWTRLPAHIKILPETEQVILDYSQEMNRKYSSAIPLVEGADQRNKIARGAVATAIRVFSVDPEDPRIVLVKPEHAKFFHKYLTSIYDSPAMSYNEFSSLNKVVFDVTAEEKEEIEEQFHQFPDRKILLRKLLGTDFLRQKDIQEMMGYDKDQAFKLLTVLNRFNMVEKRRDGYKKRPVGIDYMRKSLEELESGTKGEQGDDIL